MTEEGFRRRVYAVEWHARLWRLHGGEHDLCERMMQHCTECVEADYYGVQRPVTDEPLIAQMERYMDGLYASSNLQIFS